MQGTWLGSIPGQGTGSHMLQLRPSTAGKKKIEQAGFEGITVIWYLDNKY